MARPMKIGLDYWLFDVNFFRDEKIISISNEFGIKGDGVVIRLLSLIYENGYYIEYSQMLKLRVIKDMNGQVSEEEFDKIVEKCVSQRLFDKKLYKEYSVLTSKAIQRRFLKVLSHTRRVSDICSYSLLQRKHAISSEETAISSEETAISSEETAISSEETKVIVDNNSEETAISSEETKVIVDNNSEETAISSEETAISSEETAISSEETRVIVTETPSPLEYRDNVDIYNINNIYNNKHNGREYIYLEQRDNSKERDKGKEKEKEKESEREKERSLAKRANAFGHTLTPYIEKYGKAMIREFYDYWTEPDHQKEKMRWELERTWDTCRRLANWSRRSFDRGGSRSGKGISILEAIQAGMSTVSSSPLDTFDPTKILE